MDSLEQKLSDLYLSNMDIIGEGLPMQVNNARREFLESFNLAPLPSVKDERYRHTDLAKLFAGEWEFFFTPSQGSMERHVAVEGYNIDILNGFHHGGEQLTMLPRGIVYGSLHSAMENMSELVLSRYNTMAQNESEAITALNSLFMQDGAFVYVPAGVSAELPFVLNYVYDSQESAQMCFPRALIILEAGASADVVISHAGRGSAKFLVNFVRETYVGDNAVLNISELTDFNDSSALLCGNYLKQSASGIVNAMHVWLRGGAVRVNAVSDLAGEHCESNLYGIYFGTGDEQVDINMRINHLVPDCKSFELVKGIASGNATGAFNGLVYVAPDAQRTSALQQSRNLQMSGTARIYAEPQLEIYADDVKCSHGATVGQLDDNAVLYMRQRGLSEQEAKRLQLAGFVHDIVSRCPNCTACDFIKEQTEQRVGEL